MERAGAGLGGIGSNGHAASHAPSNAPAEKDTASLHGSFSTNNSNMVATGASNQTVNPPATLPTSSTSTSTALPTPSSGNGNVKVHSEARIAHIARTELRRALKAALNSETATTVPGQPGTTSAFSNSNGLDNSNGAAAAATTTTAAGSATATEAQEAPESIALFLNSFMRKFLEQKLFSVVRDMIEPHLRELVEEVVGEQMEGRVPQVKEEMKEEGSGIEGMKEELRKELGEQLRAELRAENTAWLAGEREKLKRELLSELSANNPPAPKPKDQPPDAELEDPLVAQPVSRSTSPSLDNDRSRSRTASPAPEPALNLPKPSKKRDPKSPFARLDAHFKDYFKSDGKRLEVVLGALRYGTELHGRVVAWGQEFNRR